MEMLIYIGKVSLYWALLYTCYQLFLHRHTFFVWNRVYLLGSLAISFALPFIIYPETAPEIPVIYQISSQAFTLSKPVTALQMEQVSFYTWTNFLWLIYLSGVLAATLYFFNQIRTLISFLNHGEQVEIDKCKVVLTNSNIGSFSFMKWIVINRNDYENHLDAILRHEMVHVRQWHSFDILFVEFLKILFWFNPILILYKKSIQEVHEFLADEVAPNREKYARFLVSYALNVPVSSRRLTNQFWNHSQLKSRVKMIYRGRSPKWLRASYILTFLFIGTICLLVGSCERSRKQGDSRADYVIKWGQIVVQPSPAPFHDNMPNALDLDTNQNSETSVTPDSEEQVLPQNPLGGRVEVVPKNPMSKENASQTDEEDILIVPEVKNRTLELRSDDNYGRLVKPPRYPEIKEKPDMSFGRDIAVGAKAENWFVVKMTIPKDSVKYSD